MKRSRKTWRQRSWLRWPCVAALAVAASAPLPTAVAQGVADSIAVGELQNPLAVEAVDPDALTYGDPLQPSLSSVPVGGYHNGPGPDAVLIRQPTNWISGPYLKAGPSLSLGEDLLDDPDVGYTIAGGFRAPLGPNLDERLFLDVGGSYLSAFGATTRLTDGRSTFGNSVTVFDDFFQSTLREIKRGTVHAGVGWYWGDVVDDRQNDPQIRFAARLGGRVGHVRGVFDEVGRRNPISGETIQPLHANTDTIGGLFAGIEGLLLARDLSFGSMALVVDGEFANDWVEFDGWGSGSLSTASITCGVMFSR